MKKPVYPKERILFMIALIISLSVWAGLIFLTKGVILAAIPIGFLIYLFAQSGLISYLKGTGGLVSDKQFPDINEKVKECAKKLGLKIVPNVYVLHGNGVFNAFATKFLRKDYIILLSDVLDSLEDDPEAINFYIGHEMGHIDRKHLFYQPILSFALILPLLGAGYSRAREYTCDLYGAACCSPEAAQKGLALLSVGAKRYKTVNMEELVAQTYETSGFWMSFHELIGSYPWLIKRLARISPRFNPDRMPRRNPLAYLPALFIPRLDITSIIIIYILILAAGGVMKGQELIENAKSKTESSLNEIEGEIGVDRSEYATNANPEELSVSDLVDFMAAEINKDVPKTVDEITILNVATRENEDTLMYHFSLSEHVDIETLKDNVYPEIRKFWCSPSSDMQIYKKSGIKIVYRYVDYANNQIGDVALDTEFCE